MPKRGNWEEIYGHYKKYAKISLTKIMPNPEFSYIFILKNSEYGREIFEYLKKGDEGFSKIWISKIWVIPLRFRHLLKNWFYLFKNFNNQFPKKPQSLAQLL